MVSLEVEWPIVVVMLSRLCFGGQRYKERREEAVLCSI